jgi:hypothetical protein
LETILDKDIRIKNAKARLQERGTKLKANDPTATTTFNDNAKRRRLDDLEDQAMKEEDPEKLNKIFEESAGSTSRPVRARTTRTRRERGPTAQGHCKNGLRVQRIRRWTKTWRSAWSSARLTRGTSWRRRR